MLIENNIADGVDFFHMDALSSGALCRKDQPLLSRSSPLRPKKGAWPRSS
jgi:hypothetical protein